jgi:hypothetical protein
MSQHSSTEWANRLQGRASGALEQLLSVLLDAQQVLTQLPSVAPQQLGDQLTRYWQAHLPGTYQQLADGGVRYLTRMALVSAAYGTAWLREALPDHRLGELGPPPSAPATPAGTDPLQWVSWYVLCAAWSAQQQAWVGRAVTALREEIDSGAVGEEEIQASAQRFLDDRMPDYLAEVTDVGMDLVADGLAVADGSLSSLSYEVLGHPPATELTVDVNGPAGTIASTELAIENNRDEPADVTCTVKATGEYRVTVDPDAFHLVAGHTRRILIRVALPESATAEPVVVGRIRVSGHGDAPQSLRVRATALPPRRPITVRALGAAADAPGDTD